VRVTESTAGIGLIAAGALENEKGLRKQAPVVGAGEWTRTTDLLITNQLLYQLSYTSKFDRQERRGV
jgi:hypothetical protein